MGKKKRGTSKSLSNIVLQILRKCFIKFTYIEYINKYQCQLKKYLSSWLRKCGNCSSPSSACGNCTTQCQQGASSKLQHLRASSNSIYVILTLNLVCELLTTVSSSRSVTLFLTKQPKFLRSLFVHCKLESLNLQFTFLVIKKLTTQYSIWSKNEAWW